MNLSKGQTITHCVRGNLLWLVAKITAKQPLIKLATDESMNIIEMYRLIYSGYEGDWEWGYEGYDESSPYSCSCPLKYLKLVPIVLNSQWREKVLAYHQK